MENWRKDIGADFKVRDPLYGYIWLTADEKRIIDTPLFQRLRRVHQLALTKYVYPTAEHSRFVHSLGAMHCATRLFVGIHENSASTNERPRATGILQLKQLRFAALLHDIGHTAFSHASEKLILGELDHEKLGHYIIEHYEPIASVLDDDKFPVLSILSTQVTQKHSLQHQVISGHLDADRADYLMRDSHACGVRYGEYDIDRYMQAFGVIEGEGQRKLFINERDIYVIESFLLARHHYNMQVVYHRTRAGYDLVLNKFLKDNLSKNKLKIKVKNNKFDKVDLDFFEGFDDYSLFEMIKRKAKQNDPWAKMLLREDHLCPVYDTTDSIDRGGETYKSVTTQLMDHGLEDGKDFFAYKQAVHSSKLTDQGDGGEPAEQIWVRTRTGRLHNILDCSSVIRSLTPVTLYRIYATRENNTVAQKICQQICKDE